MQTWTIVARWLILPLRNRYDRDRRELGRVLDPADTQEPGRRALIYPQSTWVIAVTERTYLHIRGSAFDSAN